MKLHSWIFESDDEVPTLEHVFYGRTRDDCLNVLAAHRTTDSFLDAAYGEGVFHSDDGTDVPLRVEERWEP